MLIASLAWRSLRNRRVTTGLTVLSIALSVALLLGVEALRLSARESFSSTISGTDLIVGARGGGLQLLLYTVFRMGTATNNVKWSSYEAWAKHPAVAWTIPYSLGDSHRGFRVVGTNGSFYERYRYRRTRTVEFAAGRAPRAFDEVALGSDVAAKLGYGLERKISLTHGIGAAGIMDHDDKPFRVVGVLARTATPIDRSLYITLEGMTAIHVGWQQGAPPEPGEELPAAKLTQKDLQPEAITAFLLRAKSRIDTLRIQRDVNNYLDEPLMAIIPGVAMNELWSTVKYAELALEIVGGFVVLVGLLGMLVAIYTTLNERRREMAILRALGMGPARIVALFVMESVLLAVSGCLLGVGLMYGGVLALQGIVERELGLYLRWQGLAAEHAVYLGIVVGAAVLIGLVPAWRAYRNTLADGLSVRV
ncbi:MAG: ABC transporter permease [Acidobacteriota bacterium]